MYHRITISRQWGNRFMARCACNFMAKDQPSHSAALDAGNEHLKAMATR